MGRYISRALFVFSTFLCLGLASQKAQDARKRAFDYLVSERDVNDGVWAPGERANAALGLLAMNPRRHQQESKSETGRLKLQLDIQSIAVDFLTSIRNIKIQNLAGNPLHHIDDSTLLQFAAALKGLCVDMKNYHGYNLVQEFLRRIKNPDTVLYGGIVLALCNERRRISRKATIEKLGVIKRCQTCPFYVEEVSMNILAASCIASSSRKGTELHNIVDQEIIPTLVQKLRSKQDQDGGFGGFTPTAMAAQALVRVDAKLARPGTVNRAIDRLIQYQNSDGSFGSSVGYTALALPALTGQTMADLRTTSCPAEHDDTHTVYINVKDELYSKQSARFHFDVKLHAPLLGSLLKFSKNNPHTFELKLRRSVSGPVITSVNGLRGFEGTSWKLFKVKFNGEKQDVSSTWSSIKIQQDSFFEIVLSYN